MSLSIKPLSAILQKDTDTFGKSDPYVVLILGQEKKKGTACKNCGTKPVWNQVFTFNPKENQLTIQVWDKDTFSADDQMGSTTYNLSQLYANPNQPRKQTLKLFINGKESGIIVLQFMYNGQPIGGQGGQKPPNQQMWGQGGQGGQFQNQPNQPNWNQQGQPQNNWGQPQNQGQQGWGNPQGQPNWGQQQPGNQNNQQGWGATNVQPGTQPQWPQNQPGQGQGQPAQQNKPNNQGGFIL